MLQNTFLTWLPRIIRTTMTTTAIKTRIRAYSTIPCLTVEQCAQTQVEAVQHGFHLPSERLRPVWHRPRINGSRAETENATAWSRVGKSRSTSPLDYADA